MTKIVITGANGMLGYALRRKFPEAELFDIVSSKGIKQIDITDAKSLGEVIGFLGENDFLINAAAYTDVDGAETEEGKKTSRKINVDGPTNLAKISRDKGFKIIHFSTAFVFDGKKGDYTEEDTPNPQNYYGAHKLSGEEPILSARGYVLRTDVLYGPGGPKNFVESVLRQTKEKDILLMVKDQVGSPTLTSDLAQLTRKIIHTNGNPISKYGIYHAVNKGRASKLELTEKILEILGLVRSTRAITTEDYNKDYRKGKPTAKRPEDCSLSTEKIERLNIGTKPWEEALTHYLLHSNDF